MPRRSRSSPTTVCAPAELRSCCGDSPPAVALCSTCTVRIQKLESKKGDDKGLGIFIMWQRAPKGVNPLGRLVHE